jgi:hypothetical protein
MATTISNKTQKPLSVPLPRGKVLHLGPGRSGQIASNDVEHPRVKALIDSGALEVVTDDRGQQVGSSPGGKGARPSGQGHTADSGGRRSGDR